MSSFRTSLLLAILFAAFTSPTHAQRHDYHVKRAKNPAKAVSAGIYVLGGISHASQPLAGAGGLQGQIGAFAEYARHRLRPGLDARLAGEAYSIGSIWGCCSPGGNNSQKLIGPRAAYAFGDLHPYVEALFGTGHQDDTPQADYYSATNNSHTLDSRGTATVGVFGCDFDADAHLQLRAEYSIGSISNHGYPVQNFTGGIVFRFP